VKRPTRHETWRDGVDAPTAVTCVFEKRETT
jgi:hypothetical protein